MIDPKTETNILELESPDTSFDDVDVSVGNSGFVEAIYTSSGTIVLRATDDKSKDISTKDLIELMK